MSEPEKDRNIEDLYSICAQVARVFNGRHIPLFHAEKILRAIRFDLLLKLGASKNHIATVLGIDPRRLRGEESVEVTFEQVLAEHPDILGRRDPIVAMQEATSEASMTVKDLALELQLPEDRLRPILHHAVNEGYMRRDLSSKSPKKYMSTGKVVIHARPMTGHDYQARAGRAVNVWSLIKSEDFVTISGRLTREGHARLQEKMEAGDARSLPTLGHAERAETDTLTRTGVINNAHFLVTFGPAKVGSDPRLLALDHIASAVGADVTVIPTRFAADRAAWGRIEGDAVPDIIATLEGELRSAEKVGRGPRQEYTITFGRGCTHVKERKPRRSVRKFVEVGVAALAIALGGICGHSRWHTDPVRSDTLRIGELEHNHGASARIGDLEHNRTLPSTPDVLVLEHNRHAVSEPEPLALEHNLTSQDALDWLALEHNRCSPSELELLVLEHNLTPSDTLGGLALEHNRHALSEQEPLTLEHNAQADDTVFG